jgi:hypothetical protein
MRNECPRRWRWRWWLCLLSLPTTTTTPEALISATIAVPFLVPG